MWDYENYPNGKDDEMYGLFYQQDIENIKLIDKLVSARIQEQQQQNQPHQQKPTGRRY